MTDIINYNRKSPLRKDVDSPIHSRELSPGVTVVEEDEFIISLGYLDIGVSDFTIKGDVLISDFSD